VELFFIQVIILIVILNLLKAFLRSRSKKRSKKMGGLPEQDNDAFDDFLWGDEKKRPLIDKYVGGDGRGPLGMNSDDDD